MGIRTETKKRQDEAEDKGRERAQGYKNGKGGSPKDDGYDSMTDNEKERYKKGYREGQ